MNSILTDIQEQIHSTIKENLPDLSFIELKMMAEKEKLTF